MSNSAVRSACLAVGLVSAWAPDAEAGTFTEVRVDADFGADLTHAMLMLGSTGSGGPGITLSGLSIDGMGSGYFYSPLELDSFGTSFAMLGLSGGSGSGGHHLVMSTGHLTHFFGSEFSTAFPGVIEQEIIDSLLAGTPLAQSFLAAQFSQTGINYGEISGVVSFSVGVDIGSVSVTVTTVPTPSVLGALPLVFACRRRRR